MFIKYKNTLLLSTPILWPPDEKSRLIGKDPDAEKDWRQEEKGMTENEMVGPHHQINGHEFEQTLGVGDGQGSGASCSPWGHTVGHDNQTTKYKTSMLCWWFHMRVLPPHDIPEVSAMIVLQLRKLRFVELSDWQLVRERCETYLHPSDFTVFVPSYCDYYKYTFTPRAKIMI